MQFDPFPFGATISSLMYRWNPSGLNNLRYLLAKNFGWTWDDICSQPAHYIKAILKDLEREKTNFKGMGDPRATAQAMRRAGVL